MDYKKQDDSICLVPQFIYYAAGPSENLHTRVELLSQAAFHELNT